MAAGHGGRGAVQQHVRAGVLVRVQLLHHRLAAHAGDGEIVELHPRVVAHGFRVAVHAAVAVVVTEVDVAARVHEHGSELVARRRLAVLCAWLFTNSFSPLVIGHLPERSRCW